MMDCSGARGRTRVVEERTTTALKGRPSLTAKEARCWPRCLQSKHQRVSLRPALPLQNTKVTLSSSSHQQVGMHPRKCRAKRRAAPPRSTSSKPCNVAPREVESPDDRRDASHVLATSFCGWCVLELRSCTLHCGSPTAVRGHAQAATSNSGQPRSCELRQTASPGELLTHSTGSIGFTLHWQGRSTLCQHHTTESAAVPSEPSTLSEPADREPPRTWIGLDLWRSPKSEETLSAAFPASVVAAPWSAHQRRALPPCKRYVCNIAA